MEGTLHRSQSSNDRIFSSRLSTSKTLPKVLAVFGMSRYGSERRGVEAICREAQKEKEGKGGRWTSDAGSSIINGWATNAKFYSISSDADSTTSIAATSKSVFVSTNTRSSTWPSCFCSAAA
jgi:hypothetical protein